MMIIRNLSSKESMGIKFKDGIWNKLCLKLWFKSDCFFCNMTESGLFYKRLSRIKVPSNHFLKLIWKRTVQKSIAELWTVIPNQMIKYHFPHTQFDQISDHKHHINLYGKPYTRSCLRKLDDCFFLKYGFRSDCPKEF